MQAAIQQGQHFWRRARMLDDVLAHGADGERAKERGRSALAGDIAERDSETALAVGKKIVEVAAQFARGGKILVEAALSLPGLFVEAGVFKGDGYVGGERGEHAFVLGGERMRLRTFQIQDADQAILHQKRNDEFRANGDASLDFAGEEARIGERVGDAHGAAFGSGGAGESLMEGNAHARGNGVAIAHDEGALEMLRLFIPQHDAENVIVDEFLDALRDAAQKLFAVENGSDLAADFV